MTFRNLFLNDCFTSRQYGLYIVIIHGTALNGRPGIFSGECGIEPEFEDFRQVLTETEIHIITVIPNVDIVCILECPGISGKPVVDDFEAGRKQIT